MTYFAQNIQAEVLALQKVLQKLRFFHNCLKASGLPFPGRSSRRFQATNKNGAVNWDVTTYFGRIGQPLCTISALVHEAVHSGLKTTPKQENHRPRAACGTCRCSRGLRRQPPWLPSLLEGPPAGAPPMLPRGLQADESGAQPGASWCCAF